MKRSINLRQIEAFKAVVEAGTVSQAAELMRVSQPAVSKLLAHLEEDTELELFDRIRGRLLPSATGMRLYSHIDRIFAGVRQVEHAVELIKREERGHVAIGVLPAFSGMFISHATKRFLVEHHNAHISVVGRSSQFIVDWVLRSQLDIGIVNTNLEHPLIESFPLGPGQLVCILPKEHELAGREVIEASDLDGLPFVGFSPENRTRQKIDAVLEQHGVRTKLSLEASLATAVCEMVADGMGVSVLDPLLAFSQRERLAIKRFKPTIKSDLRLCRLGANQGMKLIEDYIRAAQATAEEMFASMKVASLTAFSEK
ncbi:LysR substrate-binding domain-containing protein [Ensifer sp. YR511]|uniref:LysR substrate-binding domain-containing protein n=1 Tax=Ensifer sp. YR511 TaxID=1855294 RepID=UPI00087F1499|nr:LysR substrate-binding domain-containing protein [Ensifer sp. YR511]SDN43539.1 DNA-binding transcriptional regulator, LysR family [Ensifer sp. YR511]